MRETITISVPGNIRRQLDAFVRKGGLSRSDVLREALSDFLFLRDFKALRRKMSAKAAAQGILTDEDVFKRAS